MTGFTPVRTLLLLLALLASGRGAFAQGGHGGMGGGGLPRGGGGMPRVGGMDMPSPGNRMPGRGEGRGGPGWGGGRAHGGLQLGPPGRWWDDKKFAKSLGLNEDQQKRMDSVFGQNRDLLISRYENLRHAEARLETLTKSGKQNETSLFAEIDRVAQARADLEKAKTHYLLQIRDEMTPEQIGKLEEFRNLP